MRIRSLSVTAGFLEACPIKFDAGLTCIIGSRGTCKSTALELIRFVFDVEPDRLSRMLQPPATTSETASNSGLLRAALAGGTARCEVDLDDGSTCVVERSADGRSRVLREGVEVSDLDPRSLGLEIYSQGDLQRVVEAYGLRLSLIDRSHHAQLNALEQERSACATELRAVGPRLRQLRAEISGLSERLRLLDGHRSEYEGLQRSRPALPAEVEQERDRHRHRREVLDRLEELARARADAIETLDTLPAKGVALSQMTSALRGEVVGADVAAALEPVIALLTSVRETLPSARADKLAAAVTNFRAHAETEDAKYRALREQQRELTEALRREDALRHEIENLTKLAARRDVVTAEHDALSRKRATLRRRIEEIGESIYELRVVQVEAINAEFGHDVMLTIQPGTHSQEHRDIVTSLLEGSRLRNQVDVGRDLAERVRPSDLVDIVEAGDAKRLAEVLDRDVAQMARLVGHLLDRPELYDLEGSVFEDWLEVTLFDEGVAKPLGQLSRGQMATALLPLILRSGSGPLLFDQPEDDLDNAFISRILVPRIRELKAARQLVFVTHNANIPVLGEADRVVTMTMSSATRAAPAQGGTVEEMRVPILQVLEGGAVAFGQRRARYADLVSEL